METNTYCRFFSVLILFVRTLNWFIFSFPSPFYKKKTKTFLTTPLAWVNPDYKAALGYG